MSTSIFVSNQCLIADQVNAQLNLVKDATVKDERAFRNLVNKLQKKDQLKEEEIVELLSTLFFAVKNHENSQLENVLEETGLSIVHTALELINEEADVIRYYAYALAQTLCGCLDRDDVAASMMDQLICIALEDGTDDEEKYFKSMRTFAVCFELFGRGVERMSRARDWMLFLPFMANYITKVLVVVEHVIEKHSGLSGNISAGQKSLSKWDEAIQLVVNNCLDFIQFIHEQTVSTELTAFPFQTTNIGEEIGDIKRQYLGYYLLCLLYEKVFVNLDMELSQRYFSRFHTEYNIKRPNDQQTSQNQKTTDIHIAKSKLVCRLKELTQNSGLTISKLYLLRQCLAQHRQTNLSAEDEMYENDRQMINYRLYPIRPAAIAGFFAFSLSDKLFSSVEQPMNLFDDASSDGMSLAKKYTGIMLDLLKCPPELVCRIDKGVFSLLYLADQLDNTFKADDLFKRLPGPDGLAKEIPALLLLEVISSVAATCPNPSLRFYAYKLIEKGLKSADDEACLYIIYELLNKCPYSSMNSAAVGLLKDQISRAIDAAKYRQTASIFATPLTKSNFFPIIFNFKSAWRNKTNTFWADCNYIMQALNLYYLMLSKDYPTNFTHVWKKDSIDSVNQGYIIPLLDLLKSIQTDEEDVTQALQIDTIKHVIDKIDAELQSKK